MQAFRGDTTGREYQDLLMWQPYFAALVETNDILVTRLPDLFVDKEKMINGSERIVQLITRREGHTVSDLILYLPAEKILSSGDLVEIPAPFNTWWSEDFFYTYLEFVLQKLRGME